MTAEPNKRLILYAEDDLDDFDSVREALEQISDEHILLHAKDGTEVVSYLENDSNAKPGLILLDLNMPLMNGKEVLLWLKQNEKFRDIPLMIFTTSSREDDIKLCQKYDCTFFRKPTLYRDLLHIVKTMLQMSVAPRQ